MACDLQPVSWILSNGFSITIHAFTPSRVNGTFTLSNVTVVCDPAAEAAAAALSLTSPRPLSQTPVCVTRTASSQDELLGLLSYDASLYGNPLPPSPSRLHITLTSNVSLDGAAWAVRHPNLTRRLTTVSGDCNHTTGLNLYGGLSLLSVGGGAILRLMCLELSNLATNTLNMPRGLLSGAVWAVNVDTASRSQLWVDNSTLVLTKDEFLWQSYYVAQVLVNAAVSSSVSGFLNNFQASMTASQLRWQYAWSPHTRWRDCVLTSMPQVYDTIVPNSLIMRYLGRFLYLTDLYMVYSCQGLLDAVRNLTSTSPPYYVVLGANVSLATCWPKSGGVNVTAPMLTIMGLPDRTTTLDLAGYTDAFRQAPDATIALRYLTLLGLGSHAQNGAPSYNDVQTYSTPTDGDKLHLATLLLWAFQFSRRGLQLQLEHVAVVLPYIELEQCMNMLTQSGTVYPSLDALAQYLMTSSSLQDGFTLPPKSLPPGAATASVAVTGGDDAAASNGDPSTQLLPFKVLLLPGVRGLEVNLTSWPGHYDSWTAAMYDDTNDNASGGDGGRGGGSLTSWRIGLLAAGVAMAAAVVVAAGLLYGRRLRSCGVRKAAAAAGGFGRAARSGDDVEAGRGREAGGAEVGAAARGSAASGAIAQQAPRRPLYDSFDDPAFELELVKGAKLSPEDVADILERVNAEAAEFNIQMTEICGSGSFGVVYGGLWHGLQVAIKTMVFSESAPPLVAGKAARQQCIREAAFCCTMHHPNVVATHHYYLKSAKRTNMFDDLLLQVASDSDPEDGVELGNQLLECFRRGPKGGTGAAAAAAADASTGPDADGTPSNKTGRRTGECGGAVVAANADATAAAGAASSTEQAPGDSVKGPEEQGSRLEATAAAAAAVEGVEADPEGGVGGAGRREAEKRARLFPFRPVRLVKKNTAVTDWRLYLIQEYCDGGTLRKAIDDRKIFRHAGVKRAAAAAAAKADKVAAVQARAAPPRGGPAASSMAIGNTDAAGERHKDADGDSHSLSDCLVPYITHVAATAVAVAAPVVPPRVAAAVAPGALDRLRGAMTPLDSNVFGTAATNATQEDSIFLNTTATNCSEVNIDVGLLDPLPVTVPPLPTLWPKTPAPAPAQAEGEAQPAPPRPLPTVTPLLAAASAAPPPQPQAALASVGTADEALPSDLAVVVHTALGIASGVAYLHSRYIIHGDLSANNVLLMKTRAPQIPVVAKLSDFGLSMRLEKGQDHFKNVHHGTPYYQAPEVVEQGTSSLAADVYSLGVLLWELYHGPPPWRTKKHKVHKVKLQPLSGEEDWSRDEQPPPAPPPALAPAPAVQKPKDKEKEEEEEDLWDDPYYRLRACDVLEVAPHCPEPYARLLRRCMSPDPRDRPSARSAVKALLRMERNMAAAQAAATGGGSSAMAGAPLGAMMALSRPHLQAVPGKAHDAALLLEDFDAAAAAVAAAVTRVTAAPTVAGAPASAGAAAAAAAAAQAGAASSGILAVIGSVHQLAASSSCTALSGVVPPEDKSGDAGKGAQASSHRGKGGRERRKEEHQGSGGNHDA